MIDCGIHYFFTVIKAEHFAMNSAYMFKTYIYTLPPMEVIVMCTMHDMKVHCAFKVTLKLCVRKHVCECARTRMCAYAYIRVHLCVLMCVCVLVYACVCACVCALQDRASLPHPGWPTSSCLLLTLQVGGRN